uniref:hypothetical protein n=1 Tax=Candidatus Cryptobacteroides bacterium TaxID=3085639 RepID=UPI004029480B
VPQTHYEMQINRDFTLSRYRDIREVRKALKVNDNARIWRILEGAALVAVLAAVAVYLFSDGSSRVPHKVFREITEEIIEADK